MMLDTGRHMFAPAFIKRTIDLMAIHKMNVFHWHLTEDQGWRIEIKKYPKLTETGAWRKGSPLPAKWKNADGIRYGGFYTQEQIREIVAYAASRFIRVVPEIEMPGHAVAALASYPELGCTGGPYAVRPSWGIARDVFCAGNEQHFAFLEDVLRRGAGALSRGVHPYRRRRMPQGTLESLPKMPGCHPETWFER